MNNVHSYFNATQNYLKNSFGIRIRAELVRDLVGNPEERRILDVGCGNGMVSKQFINRNTITFLDLSENMIALVKQGMSTDELAQSSFFVGSFSDFEVHEKYNIIIAMGLLAHVPDVSECVEWVSSALAPKGVALIQFSNYDHVLTKKSINNSKQYSYSINKIRYKDIKHIIETSGMKVKKEVQFSFLLPGMGRLPEWFLYRYSKFIAKSGFFSKWGTDFIFLCEKH